MRNPAGVGALKAYRWYMRAIYMGFTWSRPFQELRIVGVLTYLRRDLSIGLGS